jgi:hypothetical protein
LPIETLALQALKSAAQTSPVARKRTGRVNFISYIYLRSMKIASICPSRAEELEGRMAIPSDATTVRP